MSFIFWKRRGVEPVEAPDGLIGGKDQVSEQHPFPAGLHYLPEGTSEYVEVDDSNGLPVSVLNIVRTGTRVIYTMEVPGIVTGAAYLDGDAFGTRFFLPGVSRSGVGSGVIEAITFNDKDDEGIQKDFVFFRSAIAGTADNSPFDPSDGDTDAKVGVVPVAVFYNWNSNRGGEATGVDLPYVADDLWCQIVTRGADNIAAGHIPTFTVKVRMD